MTRGLHARTPVPSGASGPGQDVGGADRIDLATLAQLDDGDLEQQVAGQVRALEVVVELGETINRPGELPRAERLPGLAGQCPEAAAADRPTAEPCGTPVAPGAQDQQLSDAVAQGTKQHHRRITGLQRTPRGGQCGRGVTGDDRIGDGEPGLATVALEHGLDVLLGECVRAGRCGCAHGGHLYRDGSRLEAGVATDRGDRGRIRVSVVTTELVADQPLPLLVGPVGRPRHLDVPTGGRKLGQGLQRLGQSS